MIMNDKVDFLHLDKHQSFLLVDTMFLMGLASHGQSIQTSLQCLWDISRSSEYLNFWCVYRPPSHENNLLHMIIKDYCK